MLNADRKFNYAELKTQRMCIYKVCEVNVIFSNIKMLSGPPVVQLVNKRVIFCAFVCTSISNRVFYGSLQG
jgi:hypothetical protein